MSEEGANPEKKQSHIDVQQLRTWYRAIGISEDEIAELTREPAGEKRSTAACASHHYGSHPT